MSQLCKNIDTQLHFWVNQELPELKPTPPIIEEDVTLNMESSRVMDDEEELHHPRHKLREHQSLLHDSMNESKTEERPSSAI
jgi:hypothetical protein